MIDQGIGTVEPNNADMLMGLSLQEILGLANPTLLSGFGISNDTTDPTNDIAFAVGFGRDSTNTITMRADTPMVKQLDAAWAAGTGAGGRLSAAALANTTYFPFAFQKDDDSSVDFGFDVSPTVPTLPSGYTYFRRLGGILRESGTIVPFIQSGKSFLRKTSILSYGASNPGLSAVLVPLHVPIGIVAAALFTAYLTDSTPGGATYMLVTSVSQADVAPSASNFNLSVTGSAVSASSDMSRLVDTSGQVRYRLDVTDADHTVKFVTIGWIDQLES